jgi:hypothetical protein
MILALFLAQIVFAAPIQPVPLRPGSYEVKLQIESDESLTRAVETRVRQRCIQKKHLNTQTPFSFFDTVGQCQVSEWSGGKSAIWEQFCVNELGISFGGRGRMEFGPDFYAGRVILRADPEEAPKQETRIVITAKRLGDCGAKKPAKKKKVF